MSAKILLFAMWIPTMSSEQSTGGKQPSDTELLNGLECLEGKLSNIEASELSNNVNIVVARKLFQEAQKEYTPDIAKMIEVSLYEPAMKICQEEKVPENVYEEALKSCFCDP